MSEAEFYIQTGDLTDPAHVALLERLASQRHPVIRTWASRSTAWTYVWKPLLLALRIASHKAPPDLSWEREKALRVASMVSQGVSHKDALEAVNYSSRPHSLERR